MHVIVLIY